MDEELPKTRMIMHHFENAKIDPSSEFKSPQDIIVDDNLSREQKIDLLKRWAYDAREIAVAEEENMRGSNDRHHVILEAILKSLLILGIDSDQEKSPPTKQG
jgi:hypothetical protein